MPLCLSESPLRPNYTTLLLLPKETWLLVSERTTLLCIGGRETIHTIIACFLHRKIGTDLVALKGMDNHGSSIRPIVRILGDQDAIERNRDL